MIIQNTIENGTEAQSVHFQRQSTKATQVTVAQMNIAGDTVGKLCTPQFSNCDLPLLLQRTTALQNDRQQNSLRRSQPNVNPGSSYARILLDCWGGLGDVQRNGVSREDVRSTVFGLMGHSKKG